MCWNVQDFSNAKNGFEQEISSSISSNFSVLKTLPNYFQINLKTMWLPMLKKTQLSLNVKKCDVIISLSVQYPSRQWTPHIFSSSSQHNYRSSATDGHMVQHPPCWKVLYMLGHKLKQRKSLTGWNLFDLEAFTFLCPPRMVQRTLLEGKRCHFVAKGLFSLLPLKL